MKSAQLNTSMKTIYLSCSTAYGWLGPDIVCPDYQDGRKKPCEGRKLSKKEQSKLAELTNLDIVKRGAFRRKREAELEKMK